MKRRRIFSLLLALCLIVQMLGRPEPARAGTGVTDKGDIAVMILFPYELKQQSDDIKLSLYRGETVLFEHVALENLSAQGLNITIARIDAAGNSVLQGTSCSAVEIKIPQLLLGTYRLVISGKGYKTYETQIVLERYSQYLVLANNNNTFTAGDLNGDALVNEEDLTLLKQALSGSGTDSDLNRDGKTDLIDYAYLFNNIRETNTDEAMLKNTSLIPASVIDMGSTSNSLSTYGVSPEAANQLFAQGGTPVVLQNPNQMVISEEHPITMEIPFRTQEESPELQYVTLTVPVNGTEPTSGEIIFEDAGGTEYKESFSKAVPQPVNVAGELRLFAVPSEQKIVIDFGRRIPVKRVRIKITGTAGDLSLTSIAKVEFLQEMKATSQEELNRVKFVTAESGDSSVLLKWEPLENVTEYVVRYGTEPGNYTSEYPSVRTSCEISGLQNNTTYYFTVCGKNGDWIGLPSKEVSCTPFAKEPPGRVGGVSVQEKNEALMISWGNMENTTSYKIYYKERNATNYQVISNIVENSYYLSGLKNDVEYYIMISAVNPYGEGAKSPEASGTPKLIVIQEPEGLPTYNKIDNSHIVSIRLTHPDHYNKTYYPEGVDPKNVVDGDYMTDWVARGNWWENQGFIVTFDQAYEMDHMVWVTRLDDEKFMSTINRYYVEVWGENDDLNGAGTILIPYGTRLASNPLSSKGVEVLTFPKSSVKQIKVSTKMRDGGPAPHSASELRFYKYYTLVDDITALFADSLHTTLAEGVTEEQISSYQERLNGDTGEFYVDKKILLRELEIAKSLLPGNTPLSNIIEAEAGRKAGQDTNRNFAFTLNDLQPLGVAAKTAENLIVYAEPGPDGVLPEIVMTQYAGEASNWSRESSLRPGRNIVVIPDFDSRATERGGAVYLRYHGAGGARINVFGGTQIPVLNLPEFSFETLSFNGTQFTDSNETANKEAVRKYLEELSTYTAGLKQSSNQMVSMVLNSTEIATKHVLLSLPAAAVSNAFRNYSTLEEKTQALYETLAAWEKNMQIHYSVCGLSGTAAESKNQYPSSRINIRYMTLTGKAFMYAGGAHIGIGYGSAGGLVNAPLSKAQNGLFGWGINHEIGHVLDQNRLIIGEVTNNIHSLFSQSFDGAKNLGTTRLENSIYNDVFLKTAYGAPGRTNNVFVQLAMYWQLHLAYDGTGEQSYDFYGRLYQLLRSGSVQESNPDMLFVKLACDTAQKDLSNFFAHWGYTLTDDTRAYIAKYEPELRPIYYGNDSSKRYLANGGTAVLGGSNIQVSAAQVPEASGAVSVRIGVTLPEGIDPSLVLGYEIRRNGRILAFVPAAKDGMETVYVDKELALNNSVLEYTVTAYDLAYGQTNGTSGNFKLSADGLIDSKEFTYSTDGKTVTMEASRSFDLAGLKIYTGEGSTIVLPQGTVRNGILNKETSAVTGSAVATGSVLRAKVRIGEKEVDTYLTSAYEKDGYTTYYFSETGDPEDGRIQILSTNRITVEFDAVGSNAPELGTLLFAVRYPGDNIEFYHPQEKAYIGILGEDYVYEGGSIAKGTVVVAGTFRGDPIFNIVVLKGTYSDTPAEGNDDAENLLEERILEGEQLLLAVLPENGIMTNISNGMWIYLPELKNGEKLPDTLRAELYRVDDPQTLEGQRLVSNTLAVPVPSYDTLPVIYLTGSTNTQGSGGEIK